MPRKKVLEQTRRRIAKACLQCQSGKQKCDGLRPCARCTKRERSNECEYSSHIRSYGRQRRRRQASPRSRSSSSIHFDSSGQNVPIENKSDLHVIVPSLPQSLRDSRGRALYFGNSAALSFLQNIEQLMQIEETAPVVSTCDLNCATFEDPDTDTHKSLSLYHSFDRDLLFSLVNVFFTSTCGILDIFNRSYIEGLVDSWINRTLSKSSSNTPILYLVIAYAAQTRDASEADKTISRDCFQHGQQIALLELASAPSIQTVQAFLLISLYMLGKSKRNAAHFNLGIALSAARALGYHRIHAEVDYESQLPIRIWRTLCYHDIFFCAMMGRTPSTCTTDLLEEDGSPPDKDDPDFSQQLGMIQSARAFSVMRTTIIEIYTKQSVPLGLLKRISNELQELSNTIPNELRSIEPHLSQNETPSQHQEHVLRNANVACDYHFSMMLLTRPFLVACLKIRFQNTTDPESEQAKKPQSSAVHQEVNQGAMQAVSAALSTIQLIYEIHVAGLLFNNMPLVVARVFVSALTACAAFFGRMGDHKECELAIHRADQVLQHFMNSSPQANQYDVILKTLSKAAFGLGKNRAKEDSTNVTNSMSDLFSSYSGDSSILGPSDEASRMSNMNDVDNVQRNLLYGDFLATSNPGLVESMGTQISQYEGSSLADQTLPESFGLNEPYEYDFSLDFLATDNIWDINWDGMLL